MPKKYFVFLIIFFIISSFCYYKTQRLLLLTDLSTLPLNADANPDFQPKSALSRNPVYLVSYADGKEVFFQNQLGLAQSALGRGVDFTLNYRRSLLEPNFVRENKYILDKKAGAGYWLWKPWIILDAMKKAPENAIIIYSDGGNVIKNSLAPLIELANQHPIVLSYYENPIYGTPRERVKREVFIQLGCDKAQCHDGFHIWTGFLIVRNVPEARAFIEQWLSYAKSPNLLMEGPSSKPELNGFSHHQHDQAILTVLYNRDPKGKYLVAYDAELTKKYLVWKHRRENVKLDDPYFIYESLVPSYGYTPMRKIDRSFFNAPFFKWLRYKIYSER